MLKALQNLVHASAVFFMIAGPATAGTLWVINPKDPPGLRCGLLNGWHYDRYGHHFFGPYWKCVRVKPTS